MKGEGAQGGWPKTVEFAISHLPVGWLFLAFSVFILGWVLRGVAVPVANFFQEDRENARKYELAMKKLGEARQQRAKRLAHADRRSTVNGRGKEERVN